MFFTPDEVLKQGLYELKSPDCEGKSKEIMIKTFEKHFGSQPIALSKMWNDLVTTAYRVLA